MEESAQSSDDVYNRLDWYLPSPNRDSHRLFDGQVQRSRVVARHGHCCAICLRPEISLPEPLQIHHIHPWYAGGCGGDDNALPLCSSFCHPLADLGTWSPEYLLSVAQHSSADCRSHVLDSLVPSSLQDRILGRQLSNELLSLSWKERIRTLVDTWTLVSLYNKCFPRSQQAEMAARILWAVSDAMAAYTPERERQQPWRQRSFPINRILGILFAQKARSLGKRFVDSASARCELMIGATYTATVHYRSLGYHDRALRQYRANATSLLSASDAMTAVPDKSLRAYYLAGFCIDLAQTGCKGARDMVRTCEKWALETGDHHSIADTLARCAEVELRLNRKQDCIQLLDRNTPFGPAWDIMMNDSPIVQVIAHKIRMQADPAEREYHYVRGLTLARSHGLEDQARKITAKHNALLVIEK